MPRSARPARAAPPRASRTSSAVSPPSSTSRNARPAGSRFDRRHPLCAREVRQMMVEAFQRLRAMLEHPRHLIGREKTSSKPSTTSARCAGLRHQPHRRIENRRQRPFRADHRARQIEAVLRQQFVEIVARYATRNFRISRRESIAITIRQRAQCRAAALRCVAAVRTPAVSASAPPSVIRVPS